MYLIAIFFFVLMFTSATITKLIKPKISDDWLIFWSIILPIFSCIYFWIESLDIRVFGPIELAERIRTWE